MLFRIQRHERRPTAITLIELMVVLVVFLVLASLVAAFVYRAGPKDKEATGASMIQQSFSIAKQRAYRDRMPRGIRLLPDSNNLVRTMQYIEQPEDYSTGLLSADASDVQAKRVKIQRDPNKPGQVIDLRESILKGDYLELVTDGSMHKIDTVTQDTLTFIPTSNPTPEITTPTYNYRIIRQPRPFVGDEEIKLPRDVVIDLAPTTPPKSQMPRDPDTQLYDILFSPEGNVLRQGAFTGKFILWVRDVEQDDPTAGGQPRLITIYSRTGLIATHPINLNTGLGGYHYFTQDGRSSGM